jgi:hypothetical protein
VSYNIATATSDIRAILDGVVASTWTALGYTVDTIEWPNTYFVKPGNGAWMRVTYPQQTTIPFTYSGTGGVAQNQTTALLAIQVFAPRNAGDFILIAAVDAFRARFERQSFADGIRFSEASGPNDTAFEPQWAGRALIFPFNYIENIQL